METRLLLYRLFSLALIEQCTCIPASALLNFDDGKDQIFVVGSVGMGWDSNIFVNREGQGDFFYSASIGLEYLRRGGMITFSGSVFLDASRFDKYAEENFENPRFRGEFSKQSGRTTGTLAFGAARQSRTDTAANLRTEAWLYDAGLKVKYPVMERYTIAGGLGYDHLDFIRNQQLVDLRTYAADVDLFYVYTSERDLLAGYRVRWGETSIGSSFTDHAITVGVSGKILPKVSGIARAGYQVRELSNYSENTHESFTASLEATWNATKRTNVTAQASKDFSVSATNINIDGTTLSLDVQHAVNSKFSLHAGTGYGVNRFLGLAGAGRRDTFFTWNAGASYSVTEHFKVSLTYSHYRNWSNFAFSDFTQNSVNLTLTARF